MCCQSGSARVSVLVGLSECVLTVYVCAVSVELAGVVCRPRVIGLCLGISWWCIVGRMSCVAIIVDPSGRAGRVCIGGAGVAVYDACVQLGSSVWWLLVSSRSVWCLPIVQRMEGGGRGATLF